MRLRVTKAALGGFHRARRLMSTGERHMITGEVPVPYG
jgi:hypothetical protein